MIVERAPAAQRLLGNLDLVPCGLKNLNRSLCCFWTQIVVEGIRPQDHPGRSQVSRAALVEPVLEGLRGKDGKPPLWSHAYYELCQIAKQWCMRKKIYYSGHVGGKPGPPVEQTHRVGAHWAKPAFVIMGEKLCLVGRHIDVYRAVSLTTL